ncbi:DinB family protein [Ilumatobacter sp.]|uniref:DinB family protein n=1 Tax=Ilumatobacter sp. TaxID=1967498 RepID=UPI003AF7A34A
MIDLDEIAATLESLPSALRTLLAPYDDTTLRARPEPGEWCVLEVVAHLITCDRGAFRDRIEAIAGGVAEVPGFDAGAALDARDPMHATIGELLDELTAVRSESVAFVRSLEPTALTATAPFRDHGTFAASDFLLEWPYHDQDHIRQILDAVQRHYLPHMTAAMRTALTG